MGRCLQNTAADSQRQECHALVLAHRMVRPRVGSRCAGSRLARMARLRTVGLWVVSLRAHMAMNEWWLDGWSKAIRTSGCKKHPHQTQIHQRRTAPSKAEQHCLQKPTQPSTNYHCSPPPHKLSKKSDGDPKFISTYKSKCPPVTVQYQNAPRRQP